LDKQIVENMKAKVVIVLCGFFLFNLNAYNQEKVTHEKRIYVSPEGRMYIQKDLPVYLRIATSPEENEKSYLLKSEVTTKFSNPMYFDTEGYNTVRSPSAVDTSSKRVVYPIKDIIFEVYTDSKSPITKTDFGKTYLQNKNQKLYTQGKVKLVLKSKDAMSGVNKIYYSIDGASFKEYSDTIRLNDEKEYQIKYYAIDNVGNDEKINTLNVVIDISKPVSKLEIDGDEHENIISGQSKIVLKSEDKNGIKNIYYSVDGMPFKVYKYPIQSKYLKEGEHAISYYALDEVENKETEQKHNFYVDKTPPTIVQEILGNSIIANGQEYSSGRSKLKLTTFDNKAGIKEIYYSINGGKYKKYEKPFYLSAASGKLSIKAYAVDNVNNKSTDNQEMSKTSMPYIDLSGPMIEHKFSDPVFFARDTIYINYETKVLLKAKDSEAGVSGITYSVDGNSIKEYENPFRLESEGLHKISYTATDNVDNTNSDEFIVFVDNTGPEIYSRYSTPPVMESNNLKVYPSYVVLFLSSTDMVVGFDKMSYQMDESASLKLYDGYINGFARDKDYSIKVKAFDKLGNQTEDVINFKTDTF